MAAAWNDVPAADGLNECAALVRSAEALRTSAPELSVQLARRALLVGATDLTTVHAGETRSLAMRAQAVLAAGLVRVSQYVGAVEPGFAALTLAESGGALVLAADVRLDLAACAQDIGEPLLGGALLRPVLEAGHAPPSVRAAALARLVGCVAHVARRDDVEDALAEADRLLAAEDGLSPDGRRVERARLAVRTAAYHRWYGDNEDAAAAARDGLTLLDRISRELRAESERLRTRLVLELVCALLDEGQLWEAEEAARPTVDEPVRATSAASVGQLMLAVATRVHLPAGEVERGRGLVAQAAWLAERHTLDSLLADALTELSRLDELAGHTGDALEALRSARAAEQRRMRAMARAARHMLVQVGAAYGGRDVTQLAGALLRQLAHPAGVPVAVAAPPPPRATLPPAVVSQEPPAPSDQVGSDKDTVLLDREGLFRRLRSVRKVDRPVALTLVRLEPNKDDGDPDTGIMVGLADKVRDMAPEDAAVARSDGGELAVLLPHTTRDQAEEFAATIRETAMGSDWLADGGGKDMSISTGVVQSDPQTNDTLVDAAGLLTAARDALTPATRTPPPPPEDEKAAPQSATSEDPPTTPLPVATTGAPKPVGRSILNSLSIATGSGGRRRAPGSEPPPQEAAAQDTPVPSGWPAAPDDSQPVRPATVEPPARPKAADGASNYAETRAELARMMEVLNAKARRARNTDDNPARPAAPSTAQSTTPTESEHRPEQAPAAGPGQPGAVELPGAAESVAERPDPSGTVEPFDVPVLADVVAPRQSIPTPPEPNDMPEPPPGPDIPEPPSRPDIPQPPEREPSPPEPKSRPGVDTRSRLMAAFDALTAPVPAPAGDEPAEKGFRVDLANGIELPSRKPSTSWAELESSAVVESPAAGLFGAPAEPTDKPSLGAAFADIPTNEPAGLSAVFEHRTSSGFLAVSAPGDGPASTVEEGPPVDDRVPSGASAGLSATTYDHPIGPERRPEGLPRRGERSATTIASLLTEALAAYQATADEGGAEEPRTPDRFDSFVGDPSTNPGRHRSPE